jgi:polysaccharide pyruvyl transferase CsaB
MTPYRFLLSNTYGHPNVGDEAIVTAMIHAMHGQFADAKISLLTAFPDLTRKRHTQVRAIRSQTFQGSFNTLKAVKESDLLVIGGGGIIQDATSLGNLLFHLSHAVIAHLVGTPFVCYAVGVGPLQSRIGRQLTAAILKKAQAITVRDHYSAQLLTSIGISDNLIKATSDPAMNLPFTDEVNNDPVYQKILQTKAHDKRPLIGISLRPVLDKYNILPGEYSISAATDDLIQNVLKVADNLTKQLDVRFLFISMHPSQDDPIGHLFTRKMEGKAPVIMATGQLPPQIMMSIIGQSDLLIGMRLHSLILASRSHIPMLALSYAPKVSGFLSLLGQEKLVLRLSDWTAEKIEHLVYATWHRRAEIKEHLSQVVPRIQEEERENMKMVKYVLRNLVNVM